MLRDEPPARPLDLSNDLCRGPPSCGGEVLADHQGRKGRTSLVQISLQARTSLNVTPARRPGREISPPSTPLLLRNHWRWNHLKKKIIIIIPHQVTSLKHRMSSSTESQKHVTSEVNTLHQLVTSKRNEAILWSKNFDVTWPELWTRSTQKIKCQPRSIGTEALKYTV